MLACPFCDEQLYSKTSDGWVCRCGEMIPFGMEKDDEENCEYCPARNYPRRK
jgi:hypothetical protein